MIEVAAVLSALVRHWEDFAIIAVMLPLNALIGVLEEHQADNAISALRQRLALSVTAPLAGNRLAISGEAHQNMSEIFPSRASTTGSMP